LCDRLIVKGYIDRKTSVESRREVTLALSDSGRALVRAETARRRRAIRRIVARLDVDTQLEIVEAFGALAAAAEEVTDEAWKLGWTA
jgi:DNA-binding MarR family transcriptional regulator